MKCPECQFDNREGVKFCEECGARFELKCPACNANIPLGRKFCGECGFNLTAAKEIIGEKSETESLSSRPSTKKFSSKVIPIEGERKYVTVLFSDLTGYTAMSEKLDPEDVKEITSHIFGEISKIVGNYDGFIEKYAGDAVMAIFGVPKAHEDDPIRAVKVAREIHEMVDAISPDVESRMGQPISMHSGINTGLVVTGEVDMDRGTHGVAGDTINLASRLCSLAKPGEILIDADTCLQAEGHFECEYIEDTAVKGKADSIQVHKVLFQREKPVTIRRLSGVRADLIGRKLEMAELAEAVENLHQGKGRIFSIIGDAGTGKSRLVEEFKATLDLKEIQWLEGHAYGFTQNIPYFPMIDLLNRVFHIREGDPVESVRKKIQSRIEQIVENHRDVIPYIGGLYSLSYPEVDEVSPEFWKSRLQESTSAVLTALAKRAPTIFFLEDLHWADPSFVELLRRTCLEIRQPAIVLCVYRPIFCLFKSHQVSSIDKVYHEMRLKDLSRAESQEMVQSLLKTEKIPSELQRFIQEKIEGNPFYLEEAINSLIESKTLIRDNGHWRVEKHISEADISSTIQGVITARVDRLEQESKKILQEASVIGRSFYYEILKRTTALKNSIDKNLSSLEHLDLIKTKSIQPDLEYIFKHALTQEVVYNGLLKKERREIHERIAIVMEQLFHDRLPEFYETLAFHYKNSHNSLKALDYYMKSAEKSWQKFALEEAHQHYKLAFELLDSKQNKNKKEKEIIIDILGNWAVVYNYRAESAEMVDLLKAHESLTESLDDKEKLGIFYAWLGGGLHVLLRTKEAYHYLLKALRFGEQINNPKVICSSCNWLSFVCADLGLLDKAVAFGEKAKEKGKLLRSDRSIYYRSFMALGMAYLYKGECKKSEEVGKAIMSLGQTHSDIRAIVYGHQVLGWRSFSAGDFPSAIECFMKVIEVTLDPIFSNIAKLFVGISYLSLNKPKEAEKFIYQYVEFGEKSGFMKSTGHAVLGLLELARGNLSQGIKAVNEAQQYLLMNDNRVRYAMAENMLGQIYMRIVRKAGPKSLAYFLKNIGFLVRNIPLAAKKAEQHFNTALTVAEEIGAIGILGQAYFGLGLLYKTKKRTGRARECLSKAIFHFKQCGAELYLKNANEALESLQ